MIRVAAAINGTMFRIHNNCSVFVPSSVQFREKLKREELEFVVVEIDQNGAAERFVGQANLEMRVFEDVVMNEHNVVCRKVQMAQFLLIQVALLIS